MFGPCILPVLFAEIVFISAQPGIYEHIFNGYHANTGIMT